MTTWGFRTISSLIINAENKLINTLRLLIYQRKHA